MEYKEVFAREEISNLGQFGMKILISADHYVFRTTSGRGGISAYNPRQPSSFQNA